MPLTKRIDLLKKIVIWGSCGFVLAMVATGRTNWVMGVFAALIALLSQVTQLAVYFPFLKKLFFSAAQTRESTSLSTNMTREQAAEILGVNMSASNDDIRLAHKRLMQKIHPDRGGSEALAKQINQAKDVLIG